MVRLLETHAARIDGASSRGKVKGLLPQAVQDGVGSPEGMLVPPVDKPGPRYQSLILELDGDGHERSKLQPDGTPESVHQPAGRGWTPPERQRSRTRGSAPLPG